MLGMNARESAGLHAKWKISDYEAKRELSNT